jgi:predicted TIM-barrel fold metal-dependent hydrolase
MTDPYIIDAHVHTGFPNTFFSPEVGAAELLARMDKYRIRYSLNLGSMRNLLGASMAEMERLRREYEESEGRLYYCGFFDPNRADQDLAILARVIKWRGFKGIKIHPSFNKVSADDKRYEPIWEFAKDHDLPIVAHTWSVSSYNPVQALSTPDKFESYAARYPAVRFVLAHSGGRGEGRREAVRMAKRYDNVFMDFGGDIYCHRYFEDMEREAVLGKVMFGSDYPWIDHRSHLTRLYLAGISTENKRHVLCDTAQAVFQL